MPGYSSRIEPFANNGKGNTAEIDPAVALINTGPLIAPVTLTLLDAHQQAAERRMRKVNPVVGAALIDTGASRTCFDRDAAQQAHLPIVGTGRIASATHDNHQVPLYAGLILIPALGNLSVPEAMGATLKNQGLIALIGRDALHGAVFVYNGIDGSFTIVR